MLKTKVNGSGYHCDNSDSVHRVHRGISKMFTDMKIKLRELDLRVRTLEKKEDEIGEKLGKIFDALQDIKLELKDKQDRQ